MLKIEKLIRKTEEQKARRSINEDEKPCERESGMRRAS
jgi:hypothetical protein